MSLLDPLDPLLPDSSPINPKDDDVDGILTSQTMADTTSVVPTRNPVVTDPATIATSASASAQQTSAAATTVAPTTQPTSE